MVERAHSLPPLNPWWSDTAKGEALLRHRRPEDLPVPHDGDEDFDLEVQGHRTGGCGKGRGVATLSGDSGKLFTTPPSWQEEDRVRGGGKRTHGIMPEEVQRVRGQQPVRTMGPMPPTPEHSGSDVRKDPGEK
ncbi:unnamed protein product, partial [Durusdinium trenchii]